MSIPPKTKAREIKHAWAAVPSVAFISSGGSCCSCCRPSACLLRNLERRSVRENTHTHTQSVHQWASQTHAPRRPVQEGSLFGLCLFLWNFCCCFVLVLKQPWATTINFSKCINPHSFSLSPLCQMFSKRLSSVGGIQKCQPDILTWTDEKKQTNRFFHIPSSYWSEKFGWWWRAAGCRMELRLENKEENNAALSHLLWI